MTTKILRIKMTTKIFTTPFKRGSCEPCFHLYGAGELVAIVRGSNAPILEKSIRAKFEEEKQIEDGEAVRVVIKERFIKIHIFLFATGL